MLRSAQMLLLLAVASVLSGCTTKVTRRPESRADTPITVNLTASPAGNVAVLKARPPAAKPRIYSPYLEKKPVFTNAKIEEWDVAAHINERGELVAATKKWVVRDAARWNLSALENPDQAYVPPENLNLPSSSREYSHATIGAAGPSRSRTSVPGWLTGSARDVRVTGIVERASRNLANAMCQPGEVAIWDDATGYLIVSQTVLMNSGVTAGGDAGITSSNPGAGSSMATPPADRRASRTQSQSADVDLR